VTLVLLAVYAMAMVAAGIFVSRRVKTASDFFVAGRALPGSLVFVTLLAANIGAGSTVGATGLAYRHGLGAWWWSGSAAVGCVLLGLVVAPRLHVLAGAQGFLTVGDFLESRFDASVRGLVAVLLWIGTLALLAGQLMAMAWAFEVLAGVPKAWGCALAGLVLVAYFSGGGLLAAAWVNLLQLVVLLLGFALAVPFALQAVGGWTALLAATPADATPGLPWHSFFSLGWAGTLGLFLIFVPSFMISPGLVQKTFGARSAAAARGAVLANALVLAAFALVPAILGMATRVLRPGLANPELALPTFMAELAPPWLGGLGLAALFAAEISTADAVLFMLSTSLSRDLFKAFLRPDADDAALLRVGRGAAVGGGALGVGLAILLPSVVDALKAFYGLLTAALFVPLLAGLLWPRATARGARFAVIVSVVTVVGLLLVLRGRPESAWLPHAAGMVLALVALALLRGVSPRG
jgi:solute:Na+ symporter, SSS family